MHIFVVSWAYVGCMIPLGGESTNNLFDNPGLSINRKIWNHMKVHTHVLCILSPGSFQGRLLSARGILGRNESRRAWISPSGPRRHLRFEQSPGIAFLYWSTLGLIWFGSFFILAFRICPSSGYWSKTALSLPMMLGSMRPWPLLEGGKPGKKNLKLILLFTQNLFKPGQLCSILVRNITPPIPKSNVYE